MQQQEPSKEIGRGECNACGSSDGNVLFNDGHKFCFSCNTYTGKKGDDHMNVPNQAAPIRGVYQNHFTKGQVNALSDRGISQETCRFFGVESVRDSTGQITKHIYPYHDAEGAHIANKVRQVQTKGFNAEGTLPQATLFGQKHFQQAGKFITLCEGEVDAMSAYELMGSKWPVVSIKNGAQSALKDVKAQYDYLNKFETIVLCFDNDEHGKKAANAVAQLFEPNRCKIMDMEYKDANEYLKHNKREEFNRAWWNAKQYTPAGIFNLADITDRMYAENNRETVLYPYQGLNDKLFGIRTGELVTLTAGTGAGKSSLMRELMYHLLTQTTHNVGVFSLEENITQTAFHLMSVEANDRIYIDEIRKNYTMEQLKALEDKTIGTRRFFAFDHFGSMTTDEILSRVRYMVKALDCKFILIDHLSILVSGLEGADERRNIDQLMTKLRSLVEETQCAMLLVSHLRRASGDRGQEEGKEISLNHLRGSHSIAQISDAVIALERDQQAKDETQANTTTVRVLKNRYAGETGVATYLLYDKKSGRMSEIDNPFEVKDDATEMEDFL
jgi:twinkle protein